MKRLLLPLLAALASPTAVNANVDPEVHNLCKDVSDYMGCVKANSKKEGWNPFNKTANEKKRENRFDPLFNLTKEQKQDYKSCFLAGTKSRRFGHLSEDFHKRACNLIARTGLKDFPPGKKSLLGLNVGNGYGICINDSLSRRKLSEQQAVNYCSCAMGQTLKFPFKYEHYPYCFTRAVDPLVAGDMRLFIKENGKYSWSYGLREDSLRQAKIRDKYGRYLSFNARSTNAYSGEYIPGERGYIDCDWGSSGSISGDRDSISGGYSSSGGCVGEDSTPSITIPGGIDEEVYSYLLDCKDKTFDRKGDRISVSGGFNKGWQDVSNDSAASYVSETYCPVMEIVPKG